MAELALLKLLVTMLHSFIQLTSNEAGFQQVIWTDDATTPS
jgi:hypothetical protein